MSPIAVPVSPGELIDKITILEIKSARIAEPGKLANVRRELDELRRAWAESEYGRIDVAADQAALYAMNERLWRIEDDIRAKESTQSFDREFIELARSVYFENDERAAIKRRINTRLGSALVEEKSYRDYRGDGPRS